MTGTPYYFFTYTKPNGRTATTRYRMTLEDAKARHGDSYTPILSTVEYRKEWDGRVKDFEAYPPGEGPVHWK